MSTRRRFLLLTFVCTLLQPLCAAADERLHAAYRPTESNLAARRAFRDMQFGIFIHWGVYSVLGRGEWVMQVEGIPIADYEPLAARFNPVDFDADAWAALFRRAGANYVTITTKHHDGFCMWDSKQTDWDIVDRSPYGRDVLKQMAAATSHHGLKLFFYYSQLDWHHPDYFPRGLTGHEAGRPESGDFNRYLDYMNAQLAELLGGDYGPIAGIWFDGWWDQQSKRFEQTADAPPRQTRLDWRLRETYDLIHRLQPAALVGANHHVLPFPGEDFQMFERDLPGENKGGHSVDAQIGQLPLETCDTVNGSWGYNADDHQFKSPRELIHYLVKAAGRDANFLLNVGPRPDGRIDEVTRARLEAIGDWLAVYGPSVIGTRIGPVLEQPWGVSTVRGDAVYLHVLEQGGADAQGWLPLVGTAELTGEPMRFDGRDLQIRRDAVGDWQVRFPADYDGIDLVLTLDTR